MTGPVEVLPKLQTYILECGYGILTNTLCKHYTHIIWLYCQYDSDV